jgi:hypothetical protein
MKSLILDFLILSSVPGVFIYLGLTQDDPPAMLVGVVTGFAVGFCLLCELKPSKEQNGK